MPDTPAPVFAARAFKSALFGTPQGEPRTRVRRTGATSDEGSETPKSKPQGILLTPGTGTSRPKRVSFGNEIGKSTKSQLEALNTTSNGGPKRTRLNEALEKARKGNEGRNNSSKKASANQKTDTTDDEWEEDNDIETDEENICSHDITVDLNEPHSQSGQYWKGEFEKYQQEAKVEMGKLLRYKQLAKSYAQEKDSEAIELAEMLRSEQEKVTKMEKKIAENASNILAEHDNPAEDASPEEVAKLSKQTALAIQYRQRVRELEDQLEEFLQDKQDEAEGRGRRSKHATASPRTQKTLMETQRELRRARSQIKETNGLRDQVSSLKQQLKDAEKRAAQAELVPQTNGTEPITTRTKDLRAQLRQAKEESKKKTEELEQLKKEYEAFRQESQTHDEDMKAVLERAHIKIADLKKEVKTLKAGQADHAEPRATRNRIQTTGSDSNDRLDELAKTKGTRLDADSRHSDRRQTSSGSGSQSDEKPRTLRDKFHEAAAPPSLAPNPAEDGTKKTMSGALVDRPNLEKPRWQPFVPRSPRNRAYLGDELSKRIQNGGVTPAGTKAKDIGLQDLSALAKTVSKAGAEEDEATNDDRLRSRFVQLNSPSETESKRATSTTRSASRSRLPPERRAAAMARIEQRRAEKLKERARNGVDKENVQP